MWQVGIIRTVEVELQNKISDLRVALDFETGAHKTNSKKANEVRKKLAKMGSGDESQELPALLTEEEMADLVLSDLEFRSIRCLSPLPLQPAHAQSPLMASCCVYFISRWKDPHCIKPIRPEVWKSSLP